MEAQPNRSKGCYDPGFGRSGSNIDLTLIAPDMEYPHLFRLSNLLDDLYIPYKVDLSLVHKLRDDGLLDQIKRHGKLFYAKENFPFKDGDIASILASYQNQPS